MNKVWTYLSSKEFTPSEISELTQLANEFVKSWTAHDNKLEAGFDLFKNRILVFTVNEEVHGASGCSIDKLLRFVKQIELKFSTQLLNRMLVAVKEGSGSIRVVNASEIRAMLTGGQINADSTVYNTAVSNSDEFSSWEQPLRQTWLNKYL